MRRVAARVASEQVLDAVLLFLQLLQRQVDALLAEGVDRQAFDELVLAARAW